ncbi:MAG: glycerol-3-phosphate dehydrogenase, partial [Betaproteobacteria bacterium]|nr:glycerol-3-phosphate dehydrogenase [Betaproteobacteria bacterium]
MRITFIGAGAWGTALAIAACRLPGRREVRLHVRDAEQAQRMRQERVNARYLRGVPLPEHLLIMDGSLDALTVGAGAQDLFIVATPMAGLRQTLQALAGVPSSVAWLCKGFEAGSGLMPHEVQAEVAPGLHAGALSGPSFAQEVAGGQPAALVA